MYADLLRAQFPDLNPEVDDLFLLEAHQIANLPERAPARELAAVVHAHPQLGRFLIARHPPIEAFLAQLLVEHRPVGAAEVGACEQVLVWEIADWIVYQRAPEFYDTGAEVDWDLRAVTGVVALDGNVIIDAGAGTGRVTFAAAPVAQVVFAVEPVATLRQYMRDKARRFGFDNVFVLDGFLSAIPLPPASADVLLTCQAIGWELAEELAEIERVVRPGGIAMHLFGTPCAEQSDNPLFQALSANGYHPDTFQEGDVRIHSYRKQIGS